MNFNEFKLDTLVLKVLKQFLKEYKLIKILYFYLSRFLNTIVYIFYNNKKICGKNKFYKIDAFIKNCKIDIIGNGNIISIGKNCKLYNVKIFVRGFNHNLILNEGCIIRNSTFWFEDSECTIIIGDQTTIEGAHIAVTEPSSRIEIGNNCMFSKDIDIRNGDSHSIFDSTTHERINYAKNIKIGNNVWLGKFVEILKGVEIGENSIVAIHSVVTKNVPSNSIVAGHPAKIVRDNVYWERERVYTNRSFDKNTPVKNHTSNLP